MTPQTIDTVETEWQFESPDLERVLAWLAAQPAHAPLTFVPTRDRVQVDAYYDTDDWRLHRAGFSLRSRRAPSTEAGAESYELTLKGLERTGEGSATSRREITQSVAVAGLEALATAGAGPVVDRLRLVAGGHALRQLFEVRTRRRTHEVRTRQGTLPGAGSRVAVVELDETTITPVHTEPVTLRRVEIEIEGAPDATATADIESFIDAMARDCELEPAATSKFEAGIAAAGFDPNGTLDFGPVARDAGDGASAFAYAWLRVHWNAFLHHEPGTRLGEDIEALHQMRVATRRLRATLGLFRDQLPPVMAQLRNELQWVGHELGAVRDLDVQIENLESLRAAAGWEDASALAPLVEVIERERREERHRLIALLDSARYDALVRDMSAALRVGSGEPGTDVFAHAAPILRKRFRQVRRDGGAISPDSAPTEYHALRIRAKRMRYSLELFGELFGRPAGRMTSVVKTLQDLLGEHQDAEVALHRLREMVVKHRAGLPAETLVAIGELRERHRVEAHALRSQFPEAFAAFLQTWRPLKRVIQARTPQRAKDEAGASSTDREQGREAMPWDPPGASESDGGSSGPGVARPVEDESPLARMRQLFQRD